MSKKKTRAAVVTACIVIAGLIGLGVYLFFSWRDSVNAADALLAQSSESVLKELASADNPKTHDTHDPVAEEESETEENVLRLIWVGDSRTLGMQDALDEPTEDIFIGAAGEGYGWLTEKGLKDLAAALTKYPNSPVIMNMGVNDYENIENYLNLYADLIRQYPDAAFYFLSVNPVDDEVDLSVTNENIEFFNGQIRSAYPDTYIDSNTYLTDNHIETFDGLHYSDEDYQTIYHFVRDTLGNQL